MNKKSSRLKKAILEITDDMVSCGILKEKDYEKITMRHLKKGKLPKISPMTSEEVRLLRE